MHLPATARIRALQRQELDTLLDWAAAEGWNPGLNDAGIFWDTDPRAFIALEVEGQLAGGGAIMSYQGAYGFMGLFIVRADLRGRGLGARLWGERKRMLLERLHPSAAVSMDGVFAMQAFYARGGFAFEHRALRFEWVVGSAQRAGSDPEGLSIVPLHELPVQDVIAFDAQHFPVPRPAFIVPWIMQPGAIALGALRDGELLGMAVARRCRVGRKVGPLFARTPAIADALLASVESRMHGERAQIDVPEPNADALKLAESRGMREVFGCARMTLGKPPAIPLARVFGVTTFELG